MNAIVKILTALATIAGIVYVIATFGDKIVAWAKKMLPTCEVEVEVEAVEAEEAPAEEAAPAEAEETIEEVVVEAGEPVADEADFAE